MKRIYSHYSLTFYYNWIQEAF